jgi:hypothetical protein
MSIQKFKSKLEKVGSWTIVKVPFDAKKVFGSAGYTKIKGTIDNVSFNGFTLMPMGEGVHFFPVKSELRKTIGKESGDPVTITLQKDSQTAVMEVPAELKSAFKASREAKKVFDEYSPSMQREHCRYIAEGKKKETREKRAVDTVLKLEKLYFEKNKK